MARKSIIPAELQPEQVVAIVDTREQKPWDLHPLQMVEGTLYAGDYSYRGGETRAAWERKSLPDFLACCGVERDRFERELVRLRGYEHRAVIIEAGWPELEAGVWKSKIKPASVIGSILSWTNSGIPIVLAGDRERAAKLVARMIFLAARNHYRQARELLGTVSEKPRLSPNAHDPVTIDSFAPTENVQL